MISHILTIAEGMKETKQNKKIIRVRSVFKESIGEIHENTREGRSTRTRKDVVGCFQDVLGKKRLLVQFEDGKKKHMSSCLLVFYV